MVDTLTCSNLGSDRDNGAEIYTYVASMDDWNKVLKYEEWDMDMRSSRQKNERGLVSLKKVKEGNLSRRAIPEKSLQDNTLLLLLLFRSPGIGSSAWF